LTNEILRRGWRTVYQSTALVQTDAPNTWRAFWRQQLRWGRSSQRETVLSLGWLWRRPFAFLCFTSDIVIPFLLYGVLAGTVVRMALGVPSPMHGSLPVQLGVAYLGMITSIGLRQVGHFRRYPRDLWALPIFVLQVTFFMAPTRLIACATMFHQSWQTRGRRKPSRGAVTSRPYEEHHEVTIVAAGTR
jgi:hyaluronan synthase